MLLTLTISDLVIHYKHSSESFWNDRKDDSAATKFRNEGNLLYKQANFFKALIKYNESLCHAETDYNLALGYGNRSAVFLEFNLFSQCLNNIRLARECNYPKEKMSTLNNREAKCLKLLKDKQQPASNDFDYFKISYEPHPTIPFIIDGLELKMDLKYGRHIITSKHLKVGDIISIETPIFSLLNSNPALHNGIESNKFNYCSFCFKNNVLDLIPCDKCPSTMFCGEGCKEESRENHQQSDCRIATQFQEMRFKFTAMKFFFKSLSIFNGSMEELEIIYNECKQSPKNVFDFNFKDLNDPEYSKNQLKVVLGLAADPTFDDDDFADFLFAAHPQLKKHEKFIRKFILHLYQVQRRTMCGIGHWSLLSENMIRIGNGIYQFGALLSHSCAPNVMRFFVGNKLCLVVIRPITKGEQIFDCYTESFYNSPASQRQLSLEHYSIKCDCEACKNPDRYPMAFHLKVKNRAVLSSGIKTCQEIGMYPTEQIPRKALIKAADRLKSIMQSTRAANLFPSQEYFMMQHFYVICIQGLTAGHEFFKLPSV